MASTTANVKIRKLPQDVVLTMTVIETPEFKVRVWAAKSLIRLASLILGCRFEVKTGRID